MRRILFTAAALLFSCCLHAQDNAGGPAVLMSYNIRSGLGMDGVRRFDRPASVITGYHPDAVAVQEIDRGTRRSGLADVLGELAARTGMKATFAPAIDFNGGQYGVGILSTEEPVSTQRVPLPGREEPRVLLMAEFENFIFCCTHLSLTPEDRLASVAVIDKAIKEFAGGIAAGGAFKPVYLAGDWNAEPSSGTIKAMEEHFTIISDTTAFTYPAGIPDRTIDYIAVWKGTGKGLCPSHLADRAVPAGWDDPARQAGATVPADTAISIASDHRPVTVTLISGTKIAGTKNTRKKNTGAKVSGAK